jgi:CheY-like chemotaxis protein
MAMSGDAPVILIDDDPQFAREVREMMGPSNRLVWLSRSRGAVERIRAAQPSWILLDLNLPRFYSRLDEEEGLELARRLLPGEIDRVILVTQAIEPDITAELLALGIHRLHMKGKPLSELLDLMGFKTDVPHAP